jgi:probable rRNA maturation factor
MIRIEVANQQSCLPLDRRRLKAAVRMVLEGSGLSEAEISLAVVDDRAIHELNRRYLDHDYPTDVLSFVLDQSAERLEGEVIVSAETALAAGPRYGLSAADELLLYVVHGVLHLVGHEDATPRGRARMRHKEGECLARCGIELPVGRRSPDRRVAKEGGP